MSYCWWGNSLFCDASNVHKQMLSLSLSLTLCPRRSTWNKIEMNCLAWRCRLKVNIAKVFPFSLPRPFVSLTICVFVFVYFRRFWYFTCEFTTSVSHHMRRKAFSYFKKSSPLRLWTIFKRSLSLSLSLSLCANLFSLYTTDRSFNNLKPELMLDLEYWKWSKLHSVKGVNWSRLNWKK